MAFGPYLMVVALFTAVSFGPLKTFLGAHSGWKFAWPGLNVGNSAGEPLARDDVQLQPVLGGGLGASGRRVAHRAAVRVSVARRPAPWSR